ncbi:MAG: hypothetical protein FAZ92_03711 [Accumulibacter sp.]|nr:MAG: hypothetical protein FAZ92_03711 [Accumulibacter sp.]
MLRHEHVADRRAYAAQIRCEELICSPQASTRVGRHAGAVLCLERATCLFFAAGRSLQTPSWTSAAMPGDSPRWNAAGWCARCRRRRSPSRCRSSTAPVDSTTRGVVGHEGQRDRLGTGGDDRLPDVTSCGRRDAMRPPTASHSCAHRMACRQTLPTGHELTHARGTAEAPEKCPSGGRSLPGRGVQICRNGLLTGSVPCPGPW